VTGPNGYSTQLSSSQTLQLVPGTYTVTANPVGAVSSNYYPAVTTQTATVSISTSTSVTVNYSTVIPNSTKVLDSAGMSSLTISPDGSTITMSTSSAVATSLAAGNVLASAPAPAAQNGLLVKILSVSTSGQTVTASVQQATLQDAIQQATFQFTETLGPANTAANIHAKKKIPSHRIRSHVRREQSNSGACAGNPDTFQLPFDQLLAGGGDASLTLTGEEDFCPSFTFALQINGFKLVSMNATVTVGVHTSVGLLDSVEESFNLTQNLETLEASPTLVFIGDIPVIVQPTLTPFVGVSGDAAANVYTGITTDSTLTVGVSYANGTWSPVDTSASPTAVSSATSVDGQVSVKAFAGLQAGVLLDGFLTPSLSGDGYLQFSSTLTGNPCWSLDAGLEANVGVSVTILGETLEDWSSPTLNLFSVPLLQATNTCFAPGLISVAPNTALVMSPQQTLALKGSNFVPDSTANFNGQALATTFLDPSDLTAVVPASDLTVAGTFPVTVTSPDNPGGTSGPVTFTVSGVTVSVSPTSASVPVGTSQQFAATVQGTSNTAVTWSVNGVIGGNTTLGTITQQGLYTAPRAVPNPANVTVTATSQADVSISASASVTVTTLSYSFVTIDDPLGPDNGASGINNGAQIVGTYGLNPAAIAGFLYASGSFTTIYDPAAGGQFAFEATEADGINDSGQIVGGYTDPNDIFHGFVYSGGSFSNIDDPAGTGTLGSTAYGINDGGQIVGVYYDSNNIPHGFLYITGSFSSIDYPNAQGTGAAGINTSGQIVGYYADEMSNNHGFLYSGGSFSSIDYPSATSTFAYGINASGQIVGQYADQAGNYHGFLYSGGNFSSIDYPNAQGTGATGINTSGQIVGYYVDQAGNENGFVATPAQ